MLENIRNRVDVSIRWYWPKSHRCLLDLASVPQPPIEKLDVLWIFDFNSKIYSVCVQKIMKNGSKLKILFQSKFQCDLKQIMDVCFVCLCVCLIIIYLDLLLCMPFVPDSFDNEMRCVNESRCLNIIQRTHKHVFIRHNFRFNIIWSVYFSNVEQIHGFQWVSGRNMTNRSWFESKFALLFQFWFNSCKLHNKIFFD